MTVKSPGRAPANDGELIRDLHDRLRVLESTKTTRVGSWVLQDIGGSLVATKPTETAAIAGAAVADAVKVDLGDLSSYVSQKDLDTVLKNFAGSLTGSITAPVGSNPLILEIQKWASGITGAISGVPSIGGIVEAITGTLGDLTDLASWALAIPATAINGVLSTFNIPGLDGSKIISGALSGALTVGGAALSTLLTNINSSGQLIASGLTGTINTAISNASTIGGITLSTLLSNINSSGQLLASGVSGFLSATTNIPGIDASKIISGALGTGLTVGGATLGTLLTNINSSGQLLAAGISGTITNAISTAATLSGTPLGTLATSWDNAVTNVTQIGTAAANAAAGVVGSLSTAATQVQTAFSGIINGIFGGLLAPPTAPTVTTQAQANTALSTVTSNIVGNATALLALQAQDAAKAALMTVKFNFADYANGSIPAAFTAFDNTTAYGVASPAGGGLAILDDRLVYTKSGTGLAAKAARYNVAPTSTDYQEISWIGTGVFSGNDFIQQYLRMNAGSTTWVGVQAWGGGLTLYANVAGVTTAIGSFGIVEQSGAKYTVKAGSLSSIYDFSLYENDTLVGTLNDASHVSQVGALYRYGGVGFTGANTGAYTGMFLNTWSLADQVFLAGPPVVTGLVTAPETTASTSYVNLTTTPTASVTIGSSGMALVLLSANLQNSTAFIKSLMSFAVSGATTQAAADSFAIGIGIAGSTSDMANIPGAWVVPNLNPGVNVFTPKARVTGGTGTFKDRRLSVIPL